MQTCIISLLELPEPSATDWALVLSHSSGGRKSEIEVPVGLLVSSGGREGECDPGLSLAPGALPVMFGVVGS